MTESGRQKLKQKLNWISIFLFLISILFWLVGQGTPNWKTGMALLSLVALTVIEFYFAENKAFKLSFAVFCLLFLFLAIKNFLAR